MLTYYILAKQIAPVRVQCDLLYPPWPLRSLVGRAYMYLARGDVDCARDEQSHRRWPPCAGSETGNAISEAKATLARRKALAFGVLERLQHPQVKRPSCLGARRACALCVSQQQQQSSWGGSSFVISLHFLSMFTPGDVKRQSLKPHDMWNTMVRAPPWCSALPTDRLTG